MTVPVGREAAFFRVLLPAPAELVADPRTSSGTSDDTRISARSAARRGRLDRRRPRGSTRRWAPEYKDRRATGTGTAGRGRSRAGGSRRRGGRELTNPRVDACGFRNSDLIASENSGHSGSPSGDRGPSIAPTSSRGEAKDDRHVTRHEIQVLRRAGHSLVETAELVGVSQRTVQRVEAEAAVTSFDTEVERGERGIGRPSKAEPLQSFLVSELIAQPDVLAVE
jgi:hypothetical protein